MKYIAIYTLDPFLDIEEYPNRIINKHCRTKKEALDFLKKEKCKRNLSFWNPQIFNLDEDRYEVVTPEELDG